jgi:hypothetical protein
VVIIEEGRRLIAEEDLLEGFKEVGGERHGGRMVVYIVCFVRSVCVSRVYVWSGRRVLAAHDQVKWGMGLFPAGGGCDHSDARRGVWRCAVAVGGRVL